MFEKINSKYDGNYDEFDRRHGKGFQTWKQQGKVQNYDGEFFRDCLHGTGTYKWEKDNGWEAYDGHFYANVKEGYGIVSLSNGSYFEGLFYNNRPFGPGVLTYENGRQDAGFWLGTKIIRLSRVVDCIIPRLASSSAGKMKLFPYRKIIVINSRNSAEGPLKSHENTPELYSNFINDPRSLFFNRRKYNKSFFKNLTYENTLNSQFSLNEIETEDPKSVTAEEKEQEIGLLRNYTLHGISLEKSKPAEKFESFLQIDENLETELACWNRNKICEEIVEQMFNFRSLEDKLSFNISSLITGDRLEFNKTGYKEKECINFLKMCSIGPSYIIKELFCSYDISEELTDARGNNSLMFATCADQHDVIDILVEHGVDINSFNDEHLTPLNLCLLRRIAQGNKIKNWESAFLPPTPKSDLSQKIEGWEGTKSFESLDRLFGDGMSIDENQIAIFSPSVQESFRNLQNLLDTTMSTITVLKFSQQKKPLKTESIYYDKNEKIVPKTIRREEYLHSVAEPTENDEYFFDLSPEPEPVIETKKPSKGKGVKEVIIEVVEEKPKNEELLKICDNITKTIEILLKKGADTNISDMPKSSILLGVFTKDPKIVEMLLKFKAFVDTRDEGLLTPLHTVVLMKPTEELLEICEILLKYNADPEAKTAPDFNPNGEREIFLDEEHGRTPLQLLCMRPDLDYIKDNKHDINLQYLIEIALKLAKKSDRKIFFKGYNFLALAMLRNNIKLVEAFLKNGVVDPNDTCQYGSPLHVLVSTFLQIRIPYDESIQMCELLLKTGADPLKKSEKGNCVEFGYKEIEEEKEKRKLEKGKDKGKGRDHLKDHIKVVEYLDKKIKELEEKMKKEVERKKAEEMEEFEGTESILEKMIEKNTARKIRTEDKKNKEKGSVEESEKGRKIKAVSTNGKEKKEKNESKEHKGEKGRLDNGDGKERKEKSESDERKDGKGKVDAREGKQKKEEKSDIKIRKEKKDVENHSGMGKSDTDDKISKNIKENIQSEKNLKDLNKNSAIKPDESSFEGLSKKKKTDEGDTNGPRKNKTNKKGIKKSEEILAKAQHNKNSKTKSDIKKLKEKKKFEKLKNELFIKGEKIKDKPGNLSEKFQKLLYEILGHCQDSINVNDLLLPYVVLRDGDLYYHFKEQKPKNMEAYSFI